MKKYSDKDVVKIKRDFIKASNELTTLLKKKEIEQANYNIIIKNNKELVESTKEKISILWSSFDQELAILKKSKADLLNEVGLLARHQSLLKSSIDSLANALSELAEQSDKTIAEANRTLIGDLIADSKRMLAVMFKKKQEEEIVLDQLASERIKLEQIVSNLKDQEAAFAAKVSSKQKEVEDLRSQLAKSEEVIQAIRRRDHDSKVMAMRLTDEYKAFYTNQKNELRNKKV